MILLTYYKRRKSEVSERKTNRRDANNCLHEYIPNHVSNCKIQIKKKSARRHDITIFNSFCPNQLVIIAPQCISLVQVRTFISVVTIYT